jgi:hypothetical protein
MDDRETLLLKMYIEEVRSNTSSQTIRMIRNRTGTCILGLLVIYLIWLANPLGQASKTLVSGRVIESRIPNVNQYPNALEAFIELAPYIAKYEANGGLVGDYEIVLTVMLNRLIASNKKDKNKSPSKLIDTLIAGWNKKELKSYSELRKKGKMSMDDPYFMLAYMNVLNASPSTKVGSWAWTNRAGHFKHCSDKHGWGYPPYYDGLEKKKFFDKSSENRYALYTGVEGRYK